jgi:hypothetical protein|tara:strand:- start:6328 stop:6555 length:228 start_codon:yes stop_codon:yes gene_type:complete
MITITTYKLQGNGADSWHVDIHDCQTEEEATRENRISRELVFENPSISKSVDMANLNLTTMTLDQINLLKSLLGL